MVLTNEFKERIEAKIREYEKLCEVEFVPVIVGRSGDYSGFRWGVTLFSFTGALLWIWLMPRPVYSTFELELLSIALFTGFVGLLLGWAPVLRALLPKAYKRAAVEQGAALSFLREEVFATRRRTGVLIYVSLFERSAYLLADKGLTAKVPANDWAAFGARLAADFDHRNPGVTFLQALDELIEKLKVEFPPIEDRNELSDNVRIR